MQAPTTMTRDNGFNRLTAGLIGLALLAASTIGVLALNDQVELPLVGRDSQAQPAITTDRLTAIQLIEQNSFDYAASAPVNQRFLEENSFDYQPVANYATVDGIRIIEQNSFDYAAPTTSAQIRFEETNAWDYVVHARPASAAAAHSAPDFMFLEQNSWDTNHLALPEDNGSRDY